mgnify:FL=1
MNELREKVWIVTGASGGLGLAIVKTLLKENIRVAAFSRSAERMEAAVGHGEQERFLALSVKLHDEQRVIEAKKRVLAKFGTVDVVVNNAGHGQRGAIEEVTDPEARAMLDDNFFSQLNMMRQFIPVMRENGGGYFINMGSISSFTVKACSGIYAISKYAVNALTEAINQEGAPFHIRATCVKPFDLRTNYLASNHLKQPKVIIDCYNPIHQAHEVDDNETHGGQPGDPNKVAELFIKLAEEPKPPCSLFLDYPVEELVHRVIDGRRAEIDKWEKLACEFDA